MSEHASRQNTTFPSGGGQAHGYLALPPSGSGPGVIVIQEWWGLTDHIADVTDRLAAEGFVALAPDLYGGRTTHDADEAGSMMMSLPVDEAARDLGGAVDFLLGTRPSPARPPARSASAWVAASCCCSPRSRARRSPRRCRTTASDRPVPSTYTGLTAAVQGHYGLQDAFYPADDAKAQAEQIRGESGAEVEFHFYDAGHAFHNDTNKLGTYSPRTRGWPGHGRWTSCARRWSSSPLTVVGVRLVLPVTAANAAVLVAAVLVAATAAAGASATLASAPAPVPQATRTPRSAPRRPRRPCRVAAPAAPAVPDGASPRAARTPRPAAGAPAARCGPASGRTPPSGR
jgi:carboxymethylenebutenolidase